MGEEGQCAWEERMGDACEGVAAMCVGGGVRLTLLPTCQFGFFLKAGFVRESRCTEHTN